MPRAWPATLSLAVLLSAGLAPQPPEDFSGRWTLDATAIASTPAVPGKPAVAAAPGDMGSGWGSTMTITQDAKRLSVEYTILSRYDLQPPLTFTYPLDGSEGRNTVMLGRGEQTESSRAQWNGQTLIITTTFHVADRAAGKPFTAEVTRKLSLESPTTLVVEVTRAGALGGPPSSTRSVYRKVEASTFRDPAIPGFHRTVYGQEVAAGGGADWLVQRSVPGYAGGYGHCTFTPQELTQAFFDLVVWGEYGVKPTP